MSAGGRYEIVDSRYVYRLGKKRAAILAALFSIEAGEWVEADDLMPLFASEKTSRRHFIRDTLWPLAGWRYAGKQRRWVPYGPRPICEIEGTCIRLRSDWREAHREEAEEIADGRKQREDHERQRKAYRNRDRTPAGKEKPLMDKERVKQAVDALREQEEMLERIAKLEEIGQPRRRQTLGIGNRLDWLEKVFEDNRPRWEGPCPSCGHDPLGVQKIFAWKGEALH